MGRLRKDREDKSVPIRFYKKLKDVKKVAGTKSDNKAKKLVAGAAAAWFENQLKLIKEVSK